MPASVGITMDAGHLLLAGDDSSWNLSDWEWDSRTFVAVPKQEQSETTSCCKKQKSEQDQSFGDTIARSCGACKATRHGPLSFLQQADETTESTSLIGGMRSMNVPKVTEATQHNIASKSVEAVVAVHGHAEGSCQADGCSCDMAQQSVWHQKSRICDKHMSGTFLKQGKAQQFCQQCGRSHNPDAFDQGRKSCRTQLAKHAARRRKRSAAAISKQQPEDTPAATGCKAAVSIAALAMQDASSDAWLQTLCNSRQASEDVSLAQPLDPSFRHSSGSSDRSLSNRTSFPRYSSPPHISEQDSFPACEQLAMYTAGTDVLRSPAQAAAPAMPQTNPSLWPASVVAGNGNLEAAPADDPLQDVLSWQLPPLQEDSKPPVSSFDQALAFMQAGSGYSQPASAVPVPQQQQQHQQWQQQQQHHQTQQHLQQQQQEQHWQQQQQQPPHLLQSQPFVANPDLHAMMPVFKATPGANSQTTPNPCSSQAMPSLHNMPEAGAQPYTATTAAVRLSVKLFNCTPAQLPVSLRESVTGWLGNTPAHVEGYIRPGCVHLTVQTTVPAHTQSQPPSQSQPQQAQAQLPTTAIASVKTVIGHLLAGAEEDIWHSCTMLVQLGSEAAVVHQGTPLKVWTIQADSTQAQQQAQGKQGGSDQAACCSLSSSLPSQLPVLSLAEPVCLVAGVGHEQAVAVAAEGLSHDCKVLCRAGGKHLDVQMLQVDKGHNKHSLQVMIPSELPAGLLYLEVQRGSFMGPPLPLLVASTSSLASEAAIMLQRTVPSDHQGLTMDLAWLLQHVMDCQMGPRQEEDAVAATNKGANGSVPSFALQTSAILAVLARAVSSGLINLVKHLMSLVSGCIIDDLAGFRDASGMSVLHLAVHSGCMSMLALLLERSPPDCWQDKMSGPAGLTPFHLAVFLPDPQPTALLLCTSLGAHHWFTSAASDGQTPADFAARCGKTSLTHAISNTLWSQASIDPACGNASSKAVQLPVSISKGRSHDCCEEPQLSASTSTGCWSDSSSSADDESGSDADASQHGDRCLSVIPSAGQQSYRVLSAATNFVRDKRQRLAAVIRNRWTPY